MRSWIKILILLVIFLGVNACATQLGGGRLNDEALYTARSFLVGAQDEKPGYGLYSYLLFPAPPQLNNKPLYEAAVRAFLAHPPAPAMEALLPREDLNIFYLMLYDVPPSSVLRCLQHNCYPVDDEVVDWILSNYNYARAKIVLRHASAPRMCGPSIVSFTKPVNLKPAAQAATTAQEALYQDLSTSPPHLISIWVNLFIEEATGDGSSFDRSLTKLKLHFVSAIEKYANSVPEVLKACRCIMLITTEGQ